MYRTNAFLPPPSRPARGSVVLGVTAIVVTSFLTLGSLGLVVYRLGAKHGAATTEKEAVTTNATASSGSADANRTAPVEDDDPIPPPSSYLASLKARPSWGRFEDGVAGAPTEQFAPQLSRPLDVFVRSAPIAGDVERAFVICRFQSFNHHDAFAGDDLHVRAKLAALPEVAADGPEDANLGFASAPLVTLKKGDPLAFEVYDRDVFGMAVITKASATFAAPFTYVDTGAAVECRALAGAALTDAVRSYGQKADVAVAKVAKDRVDPYSPDWSADHGDRQSAERATGDVAALLGWVDPRTQRRVAGLEAATDALDAQRARVFATLHDAARDRVTFERFDVKLGRVDCDGDSCTVHISVTNHDRRDVLRFGSFLGPSAYVADARSRPLAATGAADVAPGATSEIALTSKGAALTSGPSIVGICQGSRCAPLRVK